MANGRTTRLGPGHYRHEPLVGPGFEVFLTPNEAATPNGRRSYWTWRSEIGTATGYATKAAAVDAAIAALKAAGPAKIEEPAAPPEPVEAPKPSVLHSIPLDQLCALADAGLLPLRAYIDEAVRREVGDDLYSSMAENIFGASTVEKAEPEPVGFQYKNKTSGEWVTSRAAATDATIGYLVANGYQIRLLYAGPIQYPKPAGYSV